MTVRFTNCCSPTTDLVYKLYVATIPLVKVGSSFLGLGLRPRQFVKVLSHSLQTRNCEPNFSARHRDPDKHRKKASETFLPCYHYLAAQLKYFFPSRAPLWVHVSQADGRLL